MVQKSTSVSCRFTKPVKTCGSSFSEFDLGSAGLKKAPGL